MAALDGGGGGMHGQMRRHSWPPQQRSKSLEDYDFEVHEDEFEIKGALAVPGVARPQSATEA